MIEEFKIQTNELDHAVERLRLLTSANRKLAIQSGIFTHGCLIGKRDRWGLRWSNTRSCADGGTDELASRIARLREYAEVAAPELMILAGGGVNGDALIKIRSETNIREFHVGRAARAKFDIEGEVQASLVSDLVQKLEEF